MNAAPRPVSRVEQMLVDVALEGFHSLAERIQDDRIQITIPKQYAWRGVAETFIGQRGQSLLDLIASIRMTFLARGIGAKPTESAA